MTMSYGKDFIQSDDLYREVDLISNLHVGLEIQPFDSCSKNIEHFDIKKLVKTVILPHVNGTTIAI